VEPGPVYELASGTFTSAFSSVHLVHVQHTLLINFVQHGLILKDLWKRQVRGLQWDARSLLAADRHRSAGA